MLAPVRPPPAEGIVIVTPADGVSRLALSSAARLLMVTKPEPIAVQLYVHVPRPLAGCHVTPPSTDTSTPPTTPPASLAVPVIVTAVPAGIVAPAAGAVIVEVGGVKSVHAGCAGRQTARAPWTGRVRRRGGVATHE